MLDLFDWIRLSENGAELIATLDIITSNSLSYEEGITSGPPVYGIDGPCKRCWIYPRVPGASYCKNCHRIVTESRNLGTVSRKCLLIWGYVNFLPGSVKLNDNSNGSMARSIFIKDSTHFLAVVNGYDLTEWFRKIILDDDSDLKGLLTIFPTTGKKPTFTMGDILCRAIYHGSRFPMDRLRIRYFSKPGQLKVPHMREKQGMLTFETPEFILLLEMATLFKSRLRLSERELIKQINELVNDQERVFHWGRLMGELTIEARDMLNHWELKEWSRNRIKLLCELTDHVAA